MKALVMKKPGEFAVEERIKPEPKDDEILFKTLQVGVCGTDLHAFEGTQPFFSYPRIVGHELAVAVAEIPPSARAAAGNIKEGDIVTVLPYLRCGTCIACGKGKTNCCRDLQCIGVHVDGGMREYFTLPAFYAVPAGKVKPRDIALVECFSIGFHGVRRGNPAAGEAALVVGAGPIGIGTIHGLKERGAKVIVLDINDKRLAYAKDIAKADYVINSKNLDPEKALADITGGEMPPLVIDATGNAAQMMKTFHFVSPGGTIVFVGLVRSDISFPDPLLHAKEITLKASRNATKEDFANVIAGIESGRVNTAGFVTHAATMEETVSRFADWLKPESGCIKAVVEISGS
ncbi:MAG: zinc-binding alcohol dehydrogenase family protein [Treponema sp.]|jgi:threonine dehydrogenase-like Zn-dependent dehydrogenase|nr:zinc-binding alcohol dehydrogenase family protein [Treponema sp.]